MDGSRARDRRDRHAARPAAVAGGRLAAQRAARTAGVALGGDRGVGSMPAPLLPPRAAALPAAVEAAPPLALRESIRDLLSASSGYHALDPGTRRDIAGAMVRIARTAVALADDDAAARRVLATAQDAGSSFSGVSASKVADTTHQILNAVSFPRFVTELINGVFKALNDSNQQQLHSYVELIQNVAATTDGFADANVGVSGARAWLAERFPASFVVQGDEADEFAPTAASMSPEDRAAAQAERDASTRLRLVPGGSMPSEAALKTALGLGSQDTVPGGDPEALVGLARASLARSRQQMLSTMVMMGLQRIVIESGRLSASMRFHIDTRSAAADDRGSSFDVRNETEASGGAKFGPWGAEAKVKNTIGYVSTQRTQTTEEMNTDLDLNSSVELLFKTDYVALDRLAGGPAQERIRVNALNPEAEERLATADRTARRATQATLEAGRSAQLNERLHSPPAIPAAAPGSTGDTAAGRPPQAAPAANIPAAATKPIAQKAGSAKSQPSIAGTTT
ncbi:hypothetical protein [Paraburkholderia xenovorans]|uniref:hypothetical protein n=1 Tax=Paraburkholderia xenovorans TaxID=36873 RepID=UPI0038B86B3C